MKSAYRNAECSDTRSICVLMPIVSRPHTALAERLRAVMRRKAVVDRFGARGGEDGIEISLKEVPERQVAVMVKTAGNDRPVAQNADLVTQGIAEAILL